MKKSDIEFHAYLPYGGPPLVAAANVKVTKWWEDVELPINLGGVSVPLEGGGFSPIEWTYTDPRFTKEWIEEHVSDSDMQFCWEQGCRSGWEYLDIQAEEIWGNGYQVYSAGRSGGWAYVTDGNGHPVFDRDVVDGWDAIALGKWARFVGLCRSAADDVPYQQMMSLYMNEFEQWAEEETAKAQREIDKQNALNSDVMTMAGAHG